MALEVEVHISADVQPSLGKWRGLGGAEGGWGGREAGIKASGWLQLLLFFFCFVLSCFFFVRVPFVFPTLGRSHSSSLVRHSKGYANESKSVKNTFAAEKHFGFCLGS